MRRSTSAGFTLIEMLIASLVLVVMLGIAVSGLANGGRTTGTIVSRSDLIEDTRMAGQMIADELGRAVYVYPPGSSITLLSAPNAYSTKNAKDGSNTFVIGVAPMIAYIEAPSVLATCNAATPQACMTFVAYYAVNRKTVTDAATGAKNPGADGRNDDRWLLYEYRKPLNFSGFLGTTTVPNQSSAIPSLASVPAQLTGVSGELLADGIKPDGFGLSTDAGDTICRNSQRQLVNDAGDALKYLGTGASQLDPTNTLIPGCPNAASTKKVASDNAYATIVRATLKVQAQVYGPEGLINTPVLNFAMAPRNLLTPSQ